MYVHFVAIRASFIALAVRQYSVPTRIPESSPVRVPGLHPCLRCDAEIRDQAGIEIGTRTRQRAI